MYILCTSSVHTLSLLSSSPVSGSLDELVWAFLDLVRDYEVSGGCPVLPLPLGKGSVLPCTLRTLSGPWAGGGRRAATATRFMGGTVLGFPVMSGGLQDESKTRIFKRLWSPRIDSKELIPPAYLARRAGTITLFLLGS